MGGGGKPRTARLAATYADEFNTPPFSTLDGSAEIYQKVREAVAAAGRDADSMKYSAAQTLLCGKDDAEVARRAAAIGSDVEGLRDKGLVGTPAEIVDKIGAFGELGASRIYLQVYDLDDLDHLELVASDVLPQV